MKKLVIMALGVVAVIFGADASYAADAASGGSGDLATAAKYLGAGLAIGLGTLGPGMAQGNAVRGACEGMARNPGMAGKLTTTMLIGLAIIEALAIYALVIAFMILG